MLQGEDVYIVAQQAIQFYYLLYPCKPTTVFGVGMLCIKYRHTTNYLSQTTKITTMIESFFQEEGLQESFEIDLSDEIGMEVDNERVVDKKAGDEVQNIQDLQLLERLRLGRDSEDDIPPSNSVGYADIADSDDEDYDPANPDYDDYF